MNAWYESLKRPPLTPPNWIFSPVWAALYISIAISFWLYYRTPDKTKVRSTTVLIIAHMAANLSWTFLFFKLHSPLAAFADIIFLDLSLIIMIRRIGRANRTAGLLLVPYLLWILFATYLNYGFYLLN